MSSPFLPSQQDVSGVNVAQTALTEDFISASPKYFTKYMRPSGVGTDKQPQQFNIWGVILAALTFIIILSWFELMRLIIQSFFISTYLVTQQMISYLIYTVCGTIFAMLLIYICYRIIQSNKHS
jgi:hypothetical protein